MLQPGLPIWRTLYRAVGNVMLLCASCCMLRAPYFVLRPSCFSLGFAIDHDSNGRVVMIGVKDCGSVIRSPR